MAQEKIHPGEIQPQSGARVDPRTLQAVFVVEAASGRSLGVLVDRSGLILTGSHVLESGGLIRVRPDPARRFVAHSVAIAPHLGVAVIRLNPAAVAGLRPVALPGRETKEPKKRTGIVAIRRRPGGAALFGLEGMVRGTGASRIRHTAPIGAVPIGALRRLLSVAQERAAAVDPPPAEPIPALARGISPPGAVPGQPPPDPDVRDYRIRSGETAIEFLTAGLIDVLTRRTSVSVVAGEAPRRWDRHAGPREPVVIVQVVPDLRWTGGSYAAVAGRIASYPILVGLFAFVFLFTLLVGEDDFRYFEGAGPVWRPVRAAYHFQGDFEGARLYRAGSEILPIDARRLCDPSEVYMSRKARQKPRLRTPPWRSGTDPRSLDASLQPASGTSKSERGTASWFERETSLSVASSSISRPGRASLETRTIRDTFPR